MLKLIFGGIVVASVMSMCCALAIAEDGAVKIRQMSNEEMRVAWGGVPRPGCVANGNMCQGNVPADTCGPNPNGQGGCVGKVYVETLAANISVFCFNVPTPPTPLCNEYNLWCVRWNEHSCRPDPANPVGCIAGNANGVAGRAGLKSAVNQGAPCL